METLDSPDTEPVPLITDSEGSAPATPTGDGTPVSILRNRKNSGNSRQWNLCLEYLDMSSLSLCLAIKGEIKSKTFNT